MPTKPAQIYSENKTLKERYEDAMEVLSMIADDEVTNPKIAAQILLSSHQYGRVLDKR